VFTKPLIAAAAAAGIVVTAGPALAADSGLYGASDPTYDGVYRQSMSILSLKAAGAKVPTSAVRWLKRQQCADGGYLAYRADTTAACPAPDATTFSGQESNATAMAAAALWATGNKSRARKAVAWLTDHRNSDRGWAYYPAEGATSDTNSTALAHGALALVRGKHKTPYLRSVQQRCDAGKDARGGLSFDTSSDAVNDNATAQAAWILSGGLDLQARPSVGSVPRLVCKGQGKEQASVRDAALGYLNKRLVQVKGELPYGGGYPGTDYAGAAAATLALRDSGAGRKAVRTTTRFLRKSAEQWITASGDDAPGALAMLILVEQRDGANPTARQQALVKRLGKTLTR